MSGAGGGGAAPPVAPVYTDPTNGMSFNSSDALNQEIQQRKQQEQADSLAAQQKADADKDTAQRKAVADNEADAAQFATRFGAARDSARSDVNNYFTQQGYDPSKYSDDINSLIERESRSVVDRAPNPSASFDPSAAADLVNQLVSGKRTQATQALNQTFSPSYADTNISNGWLSDAETPILSSQFDPLSAQLQNAQKRGTLNDQGYQAALKALSDSQTKAKASLDSLGSNILSTDRKGVNDYITGAKNDAAGLDLNSAGSFDPSTYASGAGDLVNRYKGSFAGDLSNAVGSTSFADLGSLLNAGGAVQGATAGGAATTPTGPGGGDVSDAYLAQQALAQQKRGIGTQSSF